MKKIKIEGKSYLIPTKWSEVTLETFLEIREVEKRREEMEEIDFIISYIYAVTGIEREKLMYFKKEECDLILKLLNELSTTVIEVSSNPIFKHKGIEYVFNTDMIFGQYVDLNNITKDQDIWEVSHKIASVFIRPAKKKILKKFNLHPKITDYKLEPYDFSLVEERAEIFKKHMSLDMIYTCIAFFLISHQN